MIFRIYKVLALLVASVVLSNCGATVPTIRAWRPWLRTDEGSKNIPMQARLSTKVTGETQTLLGDTRLRDESIRSKLNELLERRGFRLSDSASQYRMTLRYVTSNRESFAFSTWSSTMINNASLQYGASSGRMGIAIASALAGRAIATSSVKVEKKTNFVHTIALEITDSDGNPIRKSDAMWETNEPDLSIQLIPVLQVLIADLPRDPQKIVEIPEVDLSHAENYRKIYTDGKWFSCPALPFYASIPLVASLEEASARDFWATVRSAKVSRSDDPVKNPNALAAFVDLLQSAEFALPLGDKPEIKNWKDPLRQELWTKVLLGGQYFLTPQHNEVNILIELEGGRNGYTTTKCWLASDQEYDGYRSKLALWIQGLNEYYDVWRKQK